MSRARDGGGRRVGDPRLVRALSAGAFILYVAAGMWMLYRVHYAIGDALARSAAARYAVSSRDPHLGAIGFVWLPLPSLVQLPLAFGLGFLNRAELAGPLASAAFAALTIAPLARLLRALDIGSRVETVLLAVYAFNPITVFYAANGMSEAFFAFFAVLCCLSYVRWRQSGDVLRLGALGLSLGGAMLVRYEAIPFAGVFVLAVALQAARGKRTAAGALAGLPCLYAFFLWLAISFVLLGDPFFWAKGMAATGRPPEGAAWLPRSAGPLASLAYAAAMTARFAPGLLILGPVVAIRELRQARKGRRLADALSGAPVVAAALVFPLTIASLLMARRTWGNPRYFAGLLLFSVVAGAWVLRRGGPGSRPTRRWAPALVIAVVVGGCLSATLGLADPSVAAVEGEPRVFGPLTGRPSGAPPGPLGAEVDQWRRLTGFLDPRLGPDDLVLADTNVAFPAVLFSSHPDRFVIPPDRDFEQMAASPRNPLTYVIETEGPLDSLIDAVLASPPPGRRWERVGDFGVARIHRLS